MATSIRITKGYSSTSLSKMSAPAVLAAATTGPVGAVSSPTSLALAMTATLPPTYQLISRTTGNDTVQVTSSGRFEVRGLAGNDTITVRAGTTGGDFLVGGDGNDTLTAAESDDILDGGAGTDRLNGGAGNDVLIGGAGGDTLTGGDGIDTAVYSSSSAAVIISLNLDPQKSTRGAGGDATGDTLLGIENLTGSGQNDILSGNNLDNQLVGMLGNDTLRGNNGNDLLIGDTITDVDGNGIPDDDDGDGIPDGVNDAVAGGDDTLDGGSGDDRLFGGGGDDNLIGGFGHDQLYGGQGDDLLTSGDGNDLLDGGEGNDQLIASMGDDTLRGGGGNDWLNASLGNDLLYGGDGDDDLNAGDGNDQLFGEAGNDVLLGGSGNDIMSGGAGDDRLDGGTGADQLEGGDGFDTADYSAGGAVGVDLLANVASGAAAGDTFGSIEGLIGSVADDILAGDNANNSFQGGGGADLIVGQGGFDTSDYSTSEAGVTIQLNSSVADPQAAGTGTGGDAEGDSLISIERIIGSAFVDTLLGGELADTFVGGAGADVLNGNDGVDTAEYSTSSSAVNVTIDPAATTIGTGGDAEGDQITNIENLIGSAFNDVLRAGTGVNRLDGGAGNDVLAGGEGADTLIGGDGVDTIDYSGSNAAVGLGLTDLAGQATQGSGGHAQGDIIAQIENVIGSAFNDTLQGSASANRLEGGEGNDTLRGQGGADVLIGGLGTDTASYSTSASGVTVAISATATTVGSGGDAQGDQLSGIENLTGSAFADVLTGSDGDNRLDGGAGNDRLVGGLGVDTLVGGDGVDTVDYSASNAGVTVQLSANPAVGTVGSGGHAAGDILNTIESIIGSNFTDTLLGSTAGNKLVSGAGNDVMRGGSGADLLVANGSGSKTLYGDGISDGGTAGADVFQIMGGTNVIADYQSGEDILLNSLSNAALTLLPGSSTTLALRLSGTTHTTYVLVGTTADVPSASAFANQILQQDVFVDPNLIA
ncbi:MAG: Hemolysin-type calcium-binding region [Xanthobacteraceae bacterium]|nr:Hemolysin-type calcium-binding region [Xanthobacteraceae bacterium]